MLYSLSYEGERGDTVCAGERVLLGRECTRRSAGRAQSVPDDRVTCGFLNRSSCAGEARVDAGQRIVRRSSNRGEVCIAEPDLLLPRA